MKTYTQLTIELKQEIINNFINNYEQTKEHFLNIKNEINESHSMFGKDIDGRINLYQEMIDGLKNIEIN